MQYMKVNLTYIKTVSLFIFYDILSYIFYNRDSSVGIATGYGLNDRGVRVQVPIGARMLSSPYLPVLYWGPPIQWIPGVKRPEREADHSPPTNAEVKKTWL
jgi:hypothetical protein